MDRVSMAASEPIGRQCSWSRRPGRGLTLQRSVWGSAQRGRLRGLAVGEGQVSPWVAVTRALSGPMAYPGTGSGVAEVEGLPSLL